jgi:hypothetical protein
VTTALGLVGVAFFICGVIALAAGVTYSVIRLFPLATSKKKPPKPAADA